MTDIATINQTTQEIVDEFAFFDDWVQRYEYIIELGKGLKDLPDDKKDEAHKVPGCQSQVWFHARQEDGRIYFDADSDAMIVRGLVALLLRVYSGRTPEEIIGTPPAFFEVLELGSHLSGSRANGLHAMVTRIHAYAKAFRDESTDSDNVVPLKPETLN
jgi:cysteine desulfuration protein SufE